MQTIESFADLGLSERTLDALKTKGFVTPTAVQAACIPLLLEKKCDVVGHSQTGTGKTAAFSLPILETIDERINSVQAIILCPTRELAMQVSSEIESMKGDRRIQILPIYGGSSMDLQFRRLKKGVHIVVGTPGRVMDHMKRKTLSLEDVSFAVLDEADEMLNMGFIEDIEMILSATPVDKRMLLFSATMPNQILSLARRFMRAYEVVEIERESKTLSSTSQHYYTVRPSDKLELLSRIIDISPDFYGLVFCRTKMESDELSKELIARGYNAEAIHGDLAQRQRELILHKLREKRISILVATDVAARGIDVQDLTHVINYSIPQNPETYIHRIGRTGRAGKKGAAVTFVTPSETRRFTYLKRAVGAEIEQVRIPDAEKIVAMKKERILNSIVEGMKETHELPFQEIALELLEIEAPHKVVTTLLSLNYLSQLNVHSYQPIHDPSLPRRENSNYDRYEDRDRKGSRGQNRDEVRLFVARGYAHGMSKRLLVEFLKEHAHVRDQELNDVTVMEDFSFVNAKEGAAHAILTAFKKITQDGKPVVTKARTDNPNGKHLARHGQTDRFSRPPKYRREKRRYR